MDNWYYNLIDKIRNTRRTTMSLDEMLSKLPLGNTTSLATAHHKSIELITEEFNYTEPLFNQIADTENSRFVIFSAPGASGKSTLAKYISKTKGGIYWDLSKILLGEGSFHGNIAKAVGFDRISEFLKDLREGNELLVIDAFDESETIGGRIPIEFFLNDLIEVTEGSVAPTVVVLARTETALFISSFLQERDIRYSHFEIGFIVRENAKKLVYDIIKDNAPNSSEAIVNEFIEHQFRTIEILLSDKAEIDSFLGYAPVLKVLGASFNNEKNTMKYLNELKTGTTRPKLIAEIMDNLFAREQSKMHNALKQRWENKPNLKLNWDTVYTKEEQLIYIIEYLTFGSVGDLFTNSGVPLEVYDDYLKSVTNFLKQHPFIVTNCIDDSAKSDFAGPAFRDYSLACLLADDESDRNELVKIYLDESRSSDIYCVSQILFDCYKELTDKISGSSAVSYLYDSFRARESTTDISRLRIFEDDGDENNNLTDNKSMVTFASFECDHLNNNHEEDLFRLTDNNNELFFRQIINTDIDTNYKIIVGGDSVRSTRIFNSDITCKQIVWDSDTIILEGGNLGISLVSHESAINKNGRSPRFSSYRDKEQSNIKIDIPNITSYYGLLKYNHDFTSESVNDFEAFACVVRRILNSLRSHSKDTPARKKDFINNRIINGNKSKYSILEFLLNVSILYCDEQDWLYKLNADTLASLSVNWNEVRHGNLGSLHTLYNKYNSYKNNKQNADVMGAFS